MGPKPEKKTIADVCNEIHLLRSEVANAEEFRNFKLEMERFKLDCEKKLRRKDDEIQRLQGTVSVLQHSVIALKRSNNSAEQYSRRTSLRIYNVKKESNEKAEDCLKKVVDLIADPEIGAEIPTAVVDRAHRVGGGRNGKPPAIICKFATFRHRTVLYRKRKEIKAKFGYNIQLDLTKENLNLINEVRDAVEEKNNEAEEPVCDFVFADVNCTPTLKKGDEYIRFSSFKEAMEKLGIEMEDDDDNGAESEEEEDGGLAQDGAETVISA